MGAAPHRAEGERKYLRSQGELVHERAWPAGIDYVSMSADGQRGPRLPIGAGQHVVAFGATGAGKTTTARRLIAARTLAQKAALLVLDQKGDEEDVDEMRRLAAAAEVPFILFDSQDPGTDRWQPLWGSPDGVAARAVEPIKQSEPYYYDVLRRHLDIVCKVLHAADRWPPSVPFLVDACLPIRYQSIVAIAERLGADEHRLARRAVDHSRYVSSQKGTDDLSGGAFRLEVALALASRQVVTPRVTRDGEAVAVRLIEALRQRAVVMWRTHADTMPDEAAALSVLALADLHDAAELADAVDAAAGRVRRGDQDGGRARRGDPAARALAPRAGRGDHPVRRRRRGPNPAARAAGQPDRQLHRRRRAPPDLAGEPRLAREADGHPRALAVDQPNRQSRHPALRARVGAGGCASSESALTHSASSAAVKRSSTRRWPGIPCARAIRPIKLADRQPQRIDPPAPRHPCEVPVHPEDALPDLSPTPSATRTPAWSTTLRIQKRSNAVTAPQTTAGAQADIRGDGPFTAGSRANVTRIHAICR